ncbi:MAG: diacylglycerol/polyprenol kinase family protein [Planctomycetota bacterium]
MNWSRELVGAGILSGVFACLVLAAELWARLGRPRPEWTRKLVHVGGGLVCLAFPFAVSSPWTVLVMAATLTAVFALGAGLGFLKSLHSVSRRTRGSEYYPLAIFLTYVLAYGRPWLYFASVLTLAVADAFAALIGGRYGRIRYRVEESEKSLEGSLAFLGIAFAAISLPTLLMTGCPAAVCLLSASLVAVLVTGFEAVSLRGSDNLFVPIAVCAIMPKITTKPLAEVAHQNISLITICAGIGLLAWRTRVFNVGAAIASVLFAYAAWSLGSWQWALPVFLGLVTYLGAELLVPVPPERARGVRVRTVTRALLPPLTLLILANAFAKYEYYFGPYTAASAVVLTFALWTFLRHRWPESRRKRLLGEAAACLAALLLVALPIWLLQSPGAAPLVAVAGAAAGACLLDWLCTNARRSDTSEEIWGACKTLLVFGAAGAVVLLQELGGVAEWAPT